MRIIPGKTKVQAELFNGVSLVDMLIGLLGAILVVLIFLSSLPGKLAISIFIFVIFAFLLVKIDDEPNYIYVLNILKHFGYPNRYEKVFDDGEIKDISKRGMKDVAIDEVFDGKNDADNKTETKAERKARLKKEKAEKKADDKILKSKSATKEEKDAIWLKRAEQSANNSKAKRASKEAKASWYEMGDIIAYTDIKDGFIEYGGEYYGVALEIPPIEFRFFSRLRRKNAIENGLGAILRAVNPDFCMNIVKIERPVRYKHYLVQEYDKLEQLRKSYENGMLKEDELQIRVEVLYERIKELENIIDNDKVVLPFYYLVLFDADKKQLENSIRAAIETLRQGEMEARRLDSKELAIFLKYNSMLDFDEDEIDSIEPEQYAQWSMPNKYELKSKTVLTNDILTHNMRVVKYPTLVGDAWIAGVMSMSNTKVVMKCQPMDRGKAIKTLDRSLQELRSKYMSTNVDSQLIEIQNHIDTLSDLLATLSNDNESILNVNIYVTGYDIVATRNDPKLKQPPRTSYTMINNLKKNIKRVWNEQGFRLNNMEFNQTRALIGSQVSAYDPCAKDGRGMPSNTIAAAFPWIYSFVNDEHGFKLGESDSVPIFLDFFRRDSERVNSNMVIVGKSGSGKSYATKSLLTNLAADDSKIFILDPENEYSELANNMHGKFINVGNAQYGRLNPFHIITALDDDETDGTASGGSYATHLQFLEEFFKQIIPDCDTDAMEYLNSLIDRTYAKCNIYAETDLSKLKPEDYPIFDDLYDNILMEFQSTDNEYIRTMLRTLMNYISKFSSGGRNANIWNGPSTITTDENFTVFNFQSLLANRNGSIANAQMLLVLKYVDNEIIKNRDYNTKYGLKRKVVVVIDEAHVFIDAKYPIALDFMFQLAKRIRKYNGMQIVITQNIKDFVGSEEISRKSTAIINACQYSFIFSLAPNDMDDLCKLYEKAGGINENEQEQILQAPRGQAFTILGPSSRTTFKVHVPDDVVRMFEEQEFITSYFKGASGAKNWEDFLGDSRATHDRLANEKRQKEEESNKKLETKSHISFLEISSEDFEAQQKEAEEKKKAEELERVKALNPLQAKKNFAFDLSGLEDFEIPELPDDPMEFVSSGLDSKDDLDITDFLSDAPIAAGISSAFSTREAPPVIVQQAPQSSETEKLLADLLGKFSYDSMIDEIKKTVKAEIEAEKANLQIPQGVVYQQAPQSMPVQQAVPLEQPAAEETEEEFDLFASLFGEEENPGEQAVPIGKITPKQVAVPVDAEGNPVGTPTEEEDAPFDFSSLFGETEDDSSDESGFDIMKLLAMEAEKMDEVSPIDQMLTYDETVIDITLEQLAAYNAAKARA